MEATKVGEDSSLQKLIHMVQEAENKQAPMQRIADKCASYLVPVALLIAIGAYIGTGNIVTAVLFWLYFAPVPLCWRHLQRLWRQSGRRQSTV